MTTASTYTTPAAATPGTVESGMQPATSCSVISRGAPADAAAVTGFNVGTPPNYPARTWTFTKVAPA